MPVPAEFKQYEEARKSEANFTQKFLKPLLDRLGYYTVRDSHGTREFGKDLVFAEVDKFAEISYHGLQAKYEDSISLTMAEDLALDAIQAFTNPFEHPSTHNVHRITTFIAANAGTISEPARTHFFARVGSHAGSCRIFDGRDLLGLDRVAHLSRGQQIRDTLDGLLIEITFNRGIISGILKAWEEKPKALQINRLNDLAFANYFAKPLGNNVIDVDIVANYLQRVRMLNKCLDNLGAGIGTVPRNESLRAAVRNFASAILSDSDSLTTQIMAVVAQLRPLTEMGVA